MLNKIFNFNSTQSCFNIVISFILLFCVIYIFKQKNTIEKMTSDSTIDNVHQAVKDVYNIDVAAIRNLSNLAGQLTNPDGNLTIPGNLIINGNVTATGNGTFGPAYIGVGNSTNEAAFTHKSDKNNNVYAIAKTSGGNTQITGNQNSVIEFKIGENNLGTIDKQGNLQVNGTINAGNNAIMKSDGSDAIFRNRNNNTYNITIDSDKVKVGSNEVLKDGDDINILDMNTGKWYRPYGADNVMLSDGNQRTLGDNNEYIKNKIYKHRNSYPSDFRTNS